LASKLESDQSAVIPLDDYLKQKTQQEIRKLAESDDLSS
jgi:hypothetical protein